MIRYPGRIPSETPPRLAPPAFIAVEACTSVVIVGLLLVALTTTLGRMADANRWMRAQHQAAIAAESELDRLRAGAPPSSAEDLARRFPKLSLHVERTPAASPWDGFEVATVTVHKEIHGRSKVVCRLAAYLSAEKNSTSEAQP